jgi:hypothetical protein
MATVQTVIDSARYDIRDYQKGAAFDNAELLDYMNRMVGVMDSTLASLGSDLVEAEETNTDCVANQDYVDLSSMNSGNWDSIRSVWIGTNELEKIGINRMRHKRMWYSGSAEPQFWCLSNRTILFEQDCASAYTNLNIYYNLKTAALALTDSMPYNDVFNEFFRELLVLHAKAKKGGKVSRPDSIYHDMFKNRAMQENLRRDWVKKPYWLGY